MLNNVILVGKVVSLIDEKLTLAVTRSYKNEEGIYENDFIEVNLPVSIVSNTKDYLKVGDVVGIKGRIGNFNTILAEKVTFLSTKGEDKNEN